MYGLFILFFFVVFVVTAFLGPKCQLFSASTEHAFFCFVWNMLLVTATLDTIQFSFVSNFLRAVLSHICLQYRICARIVDHSSQATHSQEGSGGGLIALATAGLAANSPSKLTVYRYVGILASISYHLWRPTCVKRPIYSFFVCLFCFVVFFVVVVCRCCFLKYILCVLSILLT